MEEAIISLIFNLGEYSRSVLTKRGFGELKSMATIKKPKYSLKFLAGAYGPEDKIPLLSDLIGEKLLEVVVVGYSTWKKGSPSGIFQNNGVNLPHTDHNDLLCHFCQLIRSTPAGCSRCIASDCDAIQQYTGGTHKKPSILIAKKIESHPIKLIKHFKGKQVFCYQCHAGLFEIIRPINIEINHNPKTLLPIAGIWSGQHRLRDVPPEFIDNLASEINYSEPSKLRQAYEEMQPLDYSDIISHVNYLSKIASSIETSATNAFHAQNNVSFNLLSNNVLSILRNPLNQLVSKTESSIKYELSDSINKTLETIVSATGNSFSSLLLLPKEWENAPDSELLIYASAGAHKKSESKFIRFKKEHIDDIVALFKDKTRPSLVPINRSLLKEPFLQKINNAFGEYYEIAAVGYIPLLENEHNAILWVNLFSEENMFCATNHTLLSESIKTLNNIAETLYHIYNVVELFLQNVKRMEELRTSEQALIKNEKTITLLIHNMAHQVTRPILELKQASYVLSRGFSSDAYKIFKAALAEVERGARNFSNYEILTTDFKKLLSGMKSPDKIDLMDLINITKERMTPYLEVDQRKIDIDAKGISLPKVNGNMIAFTECFVNVFHNAIKYSVGGRPIEIELNYKKNMKQIEMKISNYGIELKKEDWDDIFKPIRRSETAKQFSIEGSGIGLYITAEFLKIHQSTIKVDSCIPADPSNKDLKRWKTTFVITLNC